MCLPDDFPNIRDNVIVYILDPILESCYKTVDISRGKKKITFLNGSVSGNNTGGMICRCNKRNLSQTPQNRFYTAGILFSEVCLLELTRSMKTIFDNTIRAELITRINTLNEHSMPQYMKIFLLRPGLTALLNL